MTSLALLYAILAHRPPPFVVLDEVDAALDEANSRKSLRILKELSQKVQCIVISHMSQYQTHHHVSSMNSS